MVEGFGLVGPEAAVGEVVLETGIELGVDPTESCRAGNQPFDVDQPGIVGPSAHELLDGVTDGISGRRFEQIGHGTDNATPGL
jgi:hypothetical protein